MNPGRRHRRPKAEVVAPGPRGGRPAERAAKRWPWLAALLPVVAVAGTALAGGVVQETNPACLEAHAILAGSASGEATRYWSAIGDVMHKNPRFHVVGEAERGVVDRVAFKQWRPRYPQKGGPEALYVAHCGHGGTCNDVAKAIAEGIPGATPAPIVFCGDLSNVLVEGQSVSLPAR